MSAQSLVGFGSSIKPQTMQKKPNNLTLLLGGEI